MSRRVVIHALLMLLVFIALMTLPPPSTGGEGARAGPAAPGVTGMQVAQLSCVTATAGT
jgi:hypothetical protein